MNADYAYITVRNLVILRIFDNLDNFFDYAIDITANTTDKDNVFRRLSGLGANFDGQGPVFTDNTSRP